MLGHRQHCGIFRLFGDALQGGCQRRKPGFCALIRELDAQVVPQHLLVGAHAGRHAVADIGEHLPELEAQLQEFGRGIGDVAGYGSAGWVQPAQDCAVVPRLRPQGTPEQDERRINPVTR